MRSMRPILLGLAGLVGLLLSGAGCSDDDPDPGGNGAAGSGASSSSSSATSSASSASSAGPGGAGGTGAAGAAGGQGGSEAGGAGGSGGSGGSGGTPGNGGAGGSGGGNGDGNDSFATATPIVPDGTGVITLQGALDPADSDHDFYVFTAQAGIVYLAMDSKPASNEYDPAYPDLVVSLYDSQMQRIALNDDAFPRFGQDSLLITVLPSIGTYYLEVQEFCELTTCANEAAYFSAITQKGYTGGVILESLFASPPPPEAAEPNDTLATAAEQEFFDSGTGMYPPSLVAGVFAGANDVDGVKFTVPTDVAVVPGNRLTARIVLQPGGIDAATGGTGASRAAGIVQLVDPVTDTVLSEVNLAAEHNPIDYPYIDAPVESGKEYLLRVAAGPAAPTGPLAPFWVSINSVRDFGVPQEISEPANDAVAGAEPLLNLGTALAPGYYTHGDLPAGDAFDHFEIAVLGKSFMQMVCRSARSGSGLQGLTATVLTTGGVPIGTSTIETSTAELNLFDIDVSGYTDLVIQMSATGQAPGVSGTYYNCGYTLY